MNVIPFLLEILVGTQNFGQYCAGKKYSIQPVSVGGRVQHRQKSKNVECNCNLVITD